MEKFFLRCAMLDDYCAAAAPAVVAPEAAVVVGCGVVVVAPAAAVDVGDERRAVSHQKEHHLPLMT